MTIALCVGSPQFPIGGKPFFRLCFSSNFDTCMIHGGCVVVYNWLDEAGPRLHPTVQAAQYAASNDG